MSTSSPPAGGGDEEARREYLLGLLLAKFRPKPPLSATDDGLTMGGRETLRLIRKIVSRRGDVDVAGLVKIFTDELRASLAELEEKRLIAPGNWSRSGTKIHLVTH